MALLEKMKRKKKVRNIEADDSKLAKLILIAAVIINFLLLLPLFDGWCLVGGDGTAHYASAQDLAFRLESGKGVFGNWNSAWSMGFPSYDYYQYFAHFFMVLLHFLTFKLVSILTIQKLLVVLCVALFPLSLYYGMTRLGLAKIPAALASLVSFLLSSSVGHGDIGFSLITHGIFTHLLALSLFPIALVRVFITLSERRGYFLSVLLLSLLLLTNPVVGYAACICAVLLLFAKLPSLKVFAWRFLCLAIIFALMFVVVSHFYVPFLTSQDFYGGAFYVNTPEYYQGSAPLVLFDLFTGRTLDFYRVPFAMMTILLFIGLYAAFRRREGFPQYIALSGFVVFLSIMFGRSFWGIVFDIIPGMGFMPVFRFMFAFQFFALFFIGYGLYFLFLSVENALRGKLRISRTILLCILILLLAMPVFAQVFLTNMKLCTIANSGFDKEDFSKLVRFLKDSPDGRFISRAELGFAEPYYENLLPLYSSHDSFSTAAMSSLDNLAFYYIQFFMFPSPSFFNLYNVKYALVPSSMPPTSSFFTQVFVAGNYTLYSIPTTGYFDLVDSSTALVYEGRMTSGFVRGVNWAWLNTGLMENKDFISEFEDGEQFDAGDFSQIIYEDNNALSADELKQRFKHASPAFAACGELVDEDRNLDYYAASFVANRSCYLLFKMSYHPSWQAYVDGRESRVYALSPSFMGVKVSEGSHVAEFIYKPDLRLRHWLVFAGILALLAALAYDLYPVIRRLTSGKKR